MSWRTVVISSRSKLDYHLGCLVCRGDGTKRVHLSEIATLVIESTAVSMTSALLSELVRKGIKVIICNEKYNPCAELIPYCGCHDSAEKLKSQMAWTEKNRNKVWNAIIGEKIRHQAEVLRMMGFEEPAQTLDGYLFEEVENEITTREGIASRVYFFNLFGPKFTRNDSSISINGALNYGYAMVMSAVNREIAANGYLLQLGIHHTGPDNPYNLGCDLMEPFRPVVDAMVCKMNVQKFTLEEKRVLQTLFLQTVKQNGEQRLLPHAIENYVRTVFMALSEGDTNLIQFYER